MNKNELKNSLITRGIILLIFLVGAILYSCKLDKDSKQNSSTSTAVVKRDAILKDSQIVADEVSVRTIDFDGHDLIIISLWTGAGVGLDGLHDLKICKKCRAEQGLPN